MDTISTNYHITPKSLMVETFDKFDESLAIRQSFSYQPSFNASPQSIHQSFVNSSFIKVFPHQTFVPYGITLCKVCK